MKTMTTILMVAFLSACGSMEDAQQAANAKDAKASEESSQALAAESFSLDGYVSPIAISVNGVQYRDSEDFYTKEIVRLQAEVKKQYPDYKLSFDAAVGLRNFKTGMYVFLASAGETGVASESYVDSTGKFSFMFDGSVDRKIMYTLRATKRIGLRLTKGEEVISWCYNMYAQKDMALDAGSIMLKSFETAVTQYQCSEQNDGIQLPENDVKTPMDQQWADDNAKEEARIADLDKKAKDEQKVALEVAPSEVPAPEAPAPEVPAVEVPAPEAPDAEAQP
jgi:hypothetical protein